MRTLIIAPHVDDETIGCWSVIREADQLRYVTVAWNYELTDARVQEALKTPVQERIFGFDTLTPKVLETYDQVYVPSRRDWHRDHRETNARFRRYATHFYSVDMHHGKYLGEQEAAAKHAALDEWFPSQRSLWAGDAKYYLFEDIQKTDYNVTSRITWRDYEVEVPVQHEVDVRDMLHTINAGVSGKITSRIVFNRLLELVPRGRVRLVSPYDTIYEVEN